jgi:hypothetical protein
VAGGDSSSNGTVVVINFPKLCKLYMGIMNAWLALKATIVDGLHIFVALCAH